ncbi:MAG: alpha/beta fold hydrolase [Desulfobacteraceae bacterium]|nr:MAG: alpha/beta fold hydrolase [Desulfobacteraceae bacterium]
MSTKPIRNKIVNNGTTVSYYRAMHEVTTEDGMNLIMTQKTPLSRNPKGHIMLVHGLGQNRYTWTLSKRSLENYLISEGFETFNIELRGHGLSRANGSDYPEEFETYLNYDIPAFIDAISHLTNGKKVFYMGHSLGGSIGYCIGARFQEQIAGMISIGGPFIMAKGNRLLKSIAHIGVTLGKLNPMPHLQPDVFYIDTIGAVASLGLGVFDHPWYRIPLQIWYPRSIERDILSERISKGFDRTSFNVIKFFFKWGAGGKFISSDGKIDFEEEIQNLKIPILFVNGDRDLGVLPEAVREAYEKAGSPDKIFKTFGGEEPGLHWGHIDLICGRKAPEIVWPYMLDWMNERIQSGSLFSEKEMNAA